MPSWNKKFAKESAQQEKMLGLEQGFTERMWNQTNDWNLAQWNRENAYNSPESQMERFALAGINPNNAAAAIAGNDSAAGSAQASNPSSPSTPGAPDPSGTDLAQQIAGIGGTVYSSVKTAADAYKMLKAEIPEIETNIENTEADTKKKQQDTMTGRAMEINYQSDTAHKNYETTEVMPQQVVESKQNVATSKSQEDLNRKNIENVDAAIDLAKQAKKNKEKELEVLQNQAYYWAEQVKVGQSEEAKNYARAMLDKFQSAITVKQGEIFDIDKDIKTYVRDKAKTEAKEARENNEFRQKQRRQNNDPDEHNVTTSVKKQAQLNARDAAERRIRDNMARHRLRPAVDKNGNLLNYGFDVNNKKVIVDDDGNPVYQRYRSNNHQNPVYEKKVPVYKKDRHGNTIVTYEYVDPVTGNRRPYRPKKLTDIFKK